MLFNNDDAKEQWYLPSGISGNKWWFVVCENGILLTPVLEGVDSAAHFSTVNE